MMIIIQVVKLFNVTAHEGLSQTLRNLKLGWLIGLVGGSVGRVFGWLVGLSVGQWQVGGWVDGYINLLLAVI